MKKKILTVVGSISRNAGGMQNSVRYFVENTDSRKYEKAVLSFLDEYTKEDVKHWGDQNLIIIKKFIFDKLLFNLKSYKIIKSYSPDIIHVHDIWGLIGVIVRFYCFIYNKRYIISPHGMLDEWALNNSSIIKKIAWNLYVKKNLANSSYIRTLCPSETNSVLKLGVSDRVFEIPNSIQPLTSLFNSQKLVKNNKRLIYLGRLHPKKNLINLILAWRNIPDKNGWTLSICGPSEQGHGFKLNEMIKFHNVQSIELLEPKYESNKDKFLNLATAMILPSYSEGLPMSVLEAWNHKLAVLMTKECNLEIAFERGAAIKIGTAVNEISKEVVRLISLSNEEIEDIGKKGHELLIEKFSHENNRILISKLYDSL